MDRWPFTASSIPDSKFPMEYPHSATTSSSPPARVGKRKTSFSFESASAPQLVLPTSSFPAASSSSMHESTAPSSQSARGHSSSSFPSQFTFNPSSTFSFDFTNTTAPTAQRIPSDPIEPSKPKRSRTPQNDAMFSDHRPLHAQPAGFMPRGHSRRMSHHSTESHRAAEMLFERQTAPFPASFPTLSSAAQVIEIEEIEGAEGEALPHIAPADAAAQSSVPAHSAFLPFSSSAPRTHRSPRHAQASGSDRPRSASVDVQQLLSSLASMLGASPSDAIGVLQRAHEFVSQTNAKHGGSPRTASPRTGPRFTSPSFAAAVPSATAYSAESIHRSSSGPFSLAGTNVQSTESAGIPRSTSSSVVFSSSSSSASQESSASTLYLPSSPSLSRFRSSPAGNTSPQRLHDPVGSTASGTSPLAPSGMQRSSSTGVAFSLPPQAASSSAGAGSPSHTSSGTPKHRLNIVSHSSASTASAEAQAQAVQRKKILHARFMVLRTILEVTDTKQEEILGATLERLRTYEDKIRNLEQEKKEWAEEKRRLIDSQQVAEMVRAHREASGGSESALSMDYSASSPAHHTAIQNPFADLKLPTSSASPAVFSTPLTVPSPRTEARSSMRMAVTPSSSSAAAPAPEFSEESQVDFKAAFEQIPAPLAVASLDGRFLFTNRAFHQLTGFPALQGVTLFSLVHPDDLSHALLSVNSLLTKVNDGEDQATWHHEGLRTCVFREKKIASIPLHVRVTVGQDSQRRKCLLIQMDDGAMPSI